MNSLVTVFVTANEVIKAVIPPDLYVLGKFGDLFLKELPKLSKKEKKNKTQAPTKTPIKLYCLQPLRRSGWF